MSELINVEGREHACVVTFNRPEKLNAISAEVERELCAALESRELREARSVIFTGGPRVFSAGADVNELGGLDPASIVSYYDGTGDFPERVADLPMPTFSAISGYCLGGGLELAVATDFRIADQSAVFGLPEVKLGIVPSWGGTHRLVRLLGPARAKELILLRERFSAAEAYRVGLVNDVVAEGEALDRALEHAARIATLPALAVRVTGRLIDAMPEASRQAGLELERLAYGLLAQDPEADAATARVRDR
ncbi:MAG: enoyl-CoA hydratase/isomerase family protein [Solirubrobacteraceae bacterium]|nr:enoyl-CoA hydratase/isomerase family protein [Actinomycetota bacterium]